MIKFLFIIVCFFLLLWLKTRKRKYNFKKQLKKCESPIETKLVTELFRRGFEPYTQVPVGPYRLDIALYQKRKKYCVECDGKNFHTKPEQVEHDRKRDDYMEKRGWRVIRFTGSEINSKIDWCIEVVQKQTKH